MAPAPPWEGFLRPVVLLGLAVFDAAACSVALLDADEEHLVFVAAAGAGAEEVVGVQLSVSSGIAGWVVSSGQSMAINDVRQDPRFDRDVAESTGYVPRSILAMPVETGRELIGVIEVLDRRPVEGRDDMRLLSLLAGTAAANAALARDGGGSRELDPRLAAAIGRLARLGRREQRAAAGFMDEFTTYVEHDGGPAGVV